MSDEGDSKESATILVVNMEGRCVAASGFIGNDPDTAGFDASSPNGAPGCFIPLSDKVAAGILSFEGEEGGPARTDLTLGLWGVPCDKDAPDRNTYLSAFIEQYVRGTGMFVGLDKEGKVRTLPFDLVLVIAFAMSAVRARIAGDCVPSPAPASSTEAQP